MRCRRFEKLIVEAGEAGLEPEDEMRLVEHLRACAACARFREDIAKILENSAPVALPADLDRRTKEAWLAMFDSPIAQGAKAPQGRRQAVPVWLKASLVLLAVLTTAWVVPLFDLPETGEKFTWEAGAAVLIFIQNGLALFLAPLLLRRRFTAAGRGGALTLTKTST